MILEFRVRLFFSGFEGNTQWCLRDHVVARMNPRLFPAKHVLQTFKAIYVLQCFWTHHCCLRLTLGSILRDHSCWCLNDQIGCWGLNPGQLQV